MRAILFESKSIEKNKKESEAEEMLRRTERIISMLLALAILITAMPMTVFGAAIGGVTEGSLQTESGTVDNTADMPENGEKTYVVGELENKREANAPRLFLL